MFKSARKKRRRPEKWNGRNNSAGRQSLPSDRPSTIGYQYGSHRSLPSSQYAYQNQQQNGYYGATDRQYERPRLSSYHYERRHARSTTHV